MRELKIYIIVLIVMSFFAACDTTETTPPEDNPIPADPSGVTVPIPTQNNVQPTATFTPSGNRMKINLQGLLDPSTNQPIQFSYNASNPQSSNIFVQEDGVVKGLLVTKVSSGNQLTADVVFVVDNSGSMGQEADSIALSIIAFANFLQVSGLDVRFAVVGYDDGGDVSGGISFSSAVAIESYLTRTGVSGTGRTKGFAGPDSAALDTKAINFAQEVGGENGVVGVLFADSNYTWRSGAQRVFINFTDEPTQSNGVTWNNATACSLIGGKATVHTVYSADTTRTWSSTNERPWELSTCTGGTTKFIPTDASGLNLQDLPFAGTLANSYLVEYRTSSAGTHVVKITVSTSTADGTQTFTVTY